MKREELIAKCRYYKGEEDNPFEGKDQNKAMLWFYESAWINQSLKKNGDKYLDSCIREYTNCGLSLFSDNDGIPISYKALLFNRYARTAYSMEDAVEPFKKFYHKYYFQKQ